MCLASLQKKPLYTNYVPRAKPQGARGEFGIRYHVFHCFGSIDGGSPVFRGVGCEPDGNRKQGVGVSY